MACSKCNNLDPKNLKCYVPARFFSGAYKLLFTKNFCPECGGLLGNHNPLTLEELKELSGRPVFIHSFSSKNKKTTSAAWVIIRSAVGDQAFGALVFCAVSGQNRVKQFSDYGKTWLAYSYDFVPTK